MTEIAPPGGYHNDKPIWYAGGTVGDSKRGAKQAKRRGARRADCNGQITRDGYPINAHGWPWKPKFLGRHGFAHYKRTVLLLRIPGLRTSKKCFKQNKKYGIRVTEWEVKDFGKLDDMETLDLYFQRLRADAQAVWGNDWQNHVVVKVLTDLAGGIKYAVKVLKASHRNGFKNMILARGHWSSVVINKPYITWNRGGRVA